MDGLPVVVEDSVILIGDVDVDVVGVPVPVNRNRRTRTVKGTCEYQGSIHTSRHGNHS